MKDGKKVVWFNNWFSAIVVTINDLKKEFDDVTFIGSNGKQDCTYKNCVDEFYIEPVLADSDTYIMWALDFCKHHGVDVFFPKAKMKTVAKNIKKFEKIGVKVICDDYDTISLFDSKAEVYKYLENKGYGKIPVYYVANSFADFRKYYKQITSDGDTVIIKYDKDEGAASFRVVSDNFLCVESMSETSMNILSYDNACKILQDAEDKGMFKPLMMMPKLSSPEVSVDCYMTAAGEFVAIPRYKMGNRVKQIVMTQQLIGDCAKLQEIFGFKSVYNVQYRWDKFGNPELLEINTRMSGGIHLTSMCGYSIPKQVLADALGRNLSQTKEDIKECKVTQFETPIILE